MNDVEKILKETLPNILYDIEQSNRKRTVELYKKRNRSNNEVERSIIKERIDDLDDFMNSIRDIIKKYIDEPNEATKTKCITTIGNICLNAGTEICNKCDENPKYKLHGYLSCRMKEYEPTCPLGFSDCVCDPAYHKAYHPEYYKERYGDIEPKEAVHECIEWLKTHPEVAETGSCYDDEDK